MSFRKIVVSVHDVTPFHRTSLETIFDALDTLGVFARTELIVPNFQNQFPIDTDQSFIEWMLNEKAKGSELALHGIEHQYAEFFRFDKIQAAAALTRGMTLFESAFGFVPTGFVPPQWQMSRGALSAVWEQGFQYTETLRAFYPQGKQPIPTFPINYDWGMYIVDHFFAMLNRYRCTHPRGELIRFAIHPMDVPNGLFPKACEHLKILLNAGWKPVTSAQMTSDLLYA